MREKITTDRPDANVAQTLAHETTAAVSSTGEYYPLVSLKNCQKINRIHAKILIAGWQCKSGFSQGWPGRQRSRYFFAGFCPIR